MDGKIPVSVKDVLQMWRNLTKNILANPNPAANAFCNSLG